MDMRMRDDEAGITLVEVLVSIVILGIVLTAFFRVVTGNLQSLSDSRARQDISQLTTAIVEELRDGAVGGVAMDPLFDPTTVSCGGNPGELDVFGDGTCEPLALDGTQYPAGRIDGAGPWVGTDGVIDFTTYATEVPGTRRVRVTVIAEYELTDGPRVVRRSTLFSEVGRGSG